MISGKDMGTEGLKADRYDCVVLRTFIHSREDSVMVSK